MSSEPPAFSVIVPTYRREGFLASCLSDLAAQDLDRPFEVVVVCREDDDATREVVRRACRQSPTSIRIAGVSAAGFVRALRSGLEAARGAHVAFCDDDARYPMDWLSRLWHRLEDPAVGGVGGPVVEGDARAHPIPASRVAKITWYGRTRYSPHLIPQSPGPFAVDMLPGANMAFKRQAIRDEDLDPVLDSDGFARGNELFICLRVRSRGFLLLFDPAIVVRHLAAPKVGASRRPTAARTRNYSRNLVYTMMTGLSPIGRGAFLLYLWGVGQWESPGLLLWAMARLRNRVPHANWLRTALEGRREGLRLALERR